MKLLKDPFPPTPGGFHLCVEQTLDALENKNTKQKPSRNKILILVAAILAAMATVTAVASILGNTRFKHWLSREDLGEVAALVQEAHLGDVSTDGFGFSVDEMIWEDDDLYISYSLSVPDDGRYMVALYTPTLNGEKLIYDAKGFTAPKFFDAEAASLLLLGDRHQTTCTELLTFAVDPRLKQSPDNHLRFRAVLFKTDLDLEGYGDWTGLLNPPSYISFREDWRDMLSPTELADFGVGLADLMDVLGSDTPTLNKLNSTGHAEYVAEREIDMGLDGTKLDADVLYNDVEVRDFDRLGLRVHIDRFHMTHLGIEIEYTVSAPGVDTDPSARMDAFEALEWRFCDADGESLGYDLGGMGGSGGIDALADGTPARHHTWCEDVLLPLEGLDQVFLAPCEWVDNESDNGNHPVYDMENAIALTPVYSEAIAKSEVSITPTPTIEEKEFDLSR